MPKRRLSIGELGKATATKIETIRYYEHIGLLPAPPRSANNYRVYSGHHVKRLRFIRRTRDLGFSIAQVRGLLRLAEQPQRSCDVVDAVARQHLDEVQRKIDDLTALHDELHRAIDQCGGGTIAQCRIIEAMSRTTSENLR
jgi:Cu(I)-responsive transcriptional regulator